MGIGKDANIPNFTMAQVFLLGVDFRMEIEEMDKQRAKEILSMAEDLPFEEVIARATEPEDYEKVIKMYPHGEKPLVLPCSVCREVIKAAFDYRFGGFDRKDCLQIRLRRKLQASLEPIEMKDGDNADDLCLIQYQAANAMRHVLSAIASGAN